MKSKKSSRIECYYTTVVLKSMFLFSQKVRLDRLERVIMTNKKTKSTKNARRWRQNKLGLFAEVLVGPKSNFAISLGKFALKKSANNEVFEQIKNTFQMKMDNKLRQKYK